MPGLSAQHAQAILEESFARGARDERPAAHATTTYAISA